MRIERQVECAEGVREAIGRPGAGLARWACGMAGIRRVLATLGIVALASTCSSAYAFATGRYFPLIDLASWTVNLNGADPHTAHVLAGTFTVNSIPTKLVDYGDGRAEYFTNDASGIRSHRVFTPAVLVLGQPRDRTITFNPPVPWATSDATLDVEVTGSGTATMFFTGLGSAPLDYTSSSTPVAFESVTVPAGTFNAVKFVQTLHIQGMLGGTPIDLTANATYWFVNGLGPVKQEVESHDTGQPPGPVDVRELVASSFPIARKSDLGTDGKGDIFWRNVVDGRNYVWVMDGAAHAETQLPSVGTGFQVVAVADFNGDGRMDLLWRNSTDGRNYVWLMNAGGTSRTEAQLPNVPAAFEVAGVGDFNFDGKADLLWRHASDGRNYLWLMNGASRTETQLPSVGAAYQVAATADYDGNGSTDIAWRHAASGQVYQWLIDPTTLARTETLIGTVSPANFSVITP